MQGVSNLLEMRKNVISSMRITCETNANIPRYNPRNIFSRAWLVQSHVTEYSPAQTGEYPGDIPQFKNKKITIKIK